jgi:hypothetical protein
MFSNEEFDKREYFGQGEVAGFGDFRERDRKNFRGVTISDDDESEEGEDGETGEAGDSVAIGNEELATTGIKASSAAAPRFSLLLRSPNASLVTCNFSYCFGRLTAPLAIGTLAVDDGLA